MPLLSRYITRELVLVFLAAAVVLLLVALGGRFISYLQQAAMGRISGEAVLTLLVMRLPEFFQLVLPFAFYLALVLTVSRLYADQEFAVLLSSGIAPARIVSWLLVSAVAVASIVGLLTLTVTPRMEAVRAEFMHVQRAGREFDGMLEGVFHTFSGGERVSYAEAVSADRRRLEHVFLADRTGTAGGVTIWAEQGSQYIDERTGSRFLVLENGRRYEGTPGFGDYRVVEFGAMSQRIEPPDPRLARVRISARPTRDLVGDATPESAAELHWRLALPIMTLTGALFGFGLAKAKPRQGRFSTLVPALVAVLAYYLVLLLNQHALQLGWVPLATGLWPAHLAALGLGLYLLRRVSQPVRA